MGRVRIKHEATDAYGHVTERSFERVWEPRGWVLAPEPVESADEDATEGDDSDPVEPETNPEEVATGDSDYEE